MIGAQRGKEGAPFFGSFSIASSEELQRLIGQALDDAKQVDKRPPKE
jgi:hypothetical protein